MARSTILPFKAVLAQHGIVGNRKQVTAVQVNLGKRCNLACVHCHVEAGPNRTEMMRKEVLARIVTLIERSQTVQTVDLTGGSPEMNPHFKEFVKDCRTLPVTVIDRLNPTIFFEAGYNDLPGFLADHGVVVIASLPCYIESNVDTQRGRGVFEKSIRALRQLNVLGYGQPASPLKLHLVYNPLDASLPPDQAALRGAYAERLRTDYGIVFNDLYTITNMPIKRFLHTLKRAGQFDRYMQLLATSFNARAALRVMCRELISIDWKGGLYDCDFNQMLDLPAGYRPRTVWDIEAFDDLECDPVAFEQHCYGCTAGAGSSCGGALSGLE